MVIRRGGGLLVQTDRRRGRRTGHNGLSVHGRQRRAAEGRSTGGRVGVRAGVDIALGDGVATGADKGLARIEARGCAAAPAGEGRVVGDRGGRDHDVAGVRQGQRVADDVTDLGVGRGARDFGQADGRVDERVDRHLCVLRGEAPAGCGGVQSRMVDDVQSVEVALSDRVCRRADRAFAGRKRRDRA